ncbi:MAG TPA: cyclic nucleotide-binding domain-containing protein [Promineifilum sp.]
MTDKLEFLANLPIFMDLSDSALEAVANIAGEYTFRKGAVIAYQRDIAGKFYMVMEGRLFARSLDDNGIARESGTKSYLPNDYFEDIWLFVGGVHPATIKGGEDGRILIIEGEPFVRLLKRYPSIIDDLAPREDDGVHYGLSDEAWVEAQKLKLRGRTQSSAGGAMLPEERLEFFTRRSWWVLLGNLLLPSLLVLLAAVILIVTPTDTGLERTAKIGVPVLLTLIGLIWFLLRLIDFREDFFVITNKHLTHHEFELRHFRIRLVKIPISEVQTVEVLKPSLLANLFNIGTARVTTAAVAGNVIFSNIDDPDAVKRILTRLGSQYRAIESAQSQAVLRQSIEQHFGLEPQLTREENGDEGIAPPPPIRQAGPLDGFRKRFGWRVVDGNVITYRKSLFILLREVLFPLLGFVLLGVLTGLGIYLTIDASILALVIGIGAFGVAIWFVWQLENWRNDIFQLTDRFVMDIDRKPFGFGESRKQAAIANIQNVDATRPGFLPTLFNFGFVSIDTAGAPADIVFDYVPNPEMIQADIFQRIDESRRRQRVQEGSSRREEYALLLDVYRQAMEQRRIPQRTPYEDSEEP